MTVYRTGRHNARTICIQAGSEPDRETDVQVGTMDTPELGALVVEALNARDGDRNARAYGWEVGRGQPLNAVIESTEGNPFLDSDWCADIGGTPANVPPPARLRVAGPPACSRVGLHHCAVIGGWRNHDHMNDLP